jgi:hypothetical protein
MDTMPNRGASFASPMMETTPLAPGTAEAAGATERLEDRLLATADAASPVGVSKDWLYRHADRLPFTVRLSEGQLRYSAKGSTATSLVGSGGVAADDEGDDAVV